MRPDELKQLNVALAVTVEACGAEVSAAAARLMTERLSRYPLPAVLEALTRVQDEHEGRSLPLAAIIKRIDDGRPGEEEAWAMVPKNDWGTGVMTREMMAALTVAQPLLDGGDEIGARMAFREAYRNGLMRARASGEPPHWTVSMGWDKAGCVAPLAEAVTKGRLSIEAAKNYAGPRAKEVAAMVSVNPRAAIAGTPAPAIGVAQSSFLNKSQRGP